MKTIILISALLLNFNSIIKANDGSKMLNQNLSKKVQSTLLMPKALKEQLKNETITIYFAVNENGEVTEVNAQTKNRNAKADLEKQFMKLNFKGLRPLIYNSIDVSFVVC